MTELMSRIDIGALPGLVRLDVMLDSAGSDDDPLDSEHVRVYREGGGDGCER
jgi:hypothetical protein